MLNDNSEIVRQLEQGRKKYARAVHRAKTKTAMSDSSSDEQVNALLGEYLNYCQKAYQSHRAYRPGLDSTIAAVPMHDSLSPEKVSTTRVAGDEASNIINVTFSPSATAKIAPPQPLNVRHSSLG